MLSFAELAAVLLLSATGNAVRDPAARDQAVPLRPAAVDTLAMPAGPAHSLRTAASPAPVFSLGLSSLSGTDTIPRRRPRAYEYSDGYTKRVTLHRRLSYAMLPLFAMSYFSGDQILAKGSDAPQWARSMHRPAATGSALLFGANVFTGSWNLIEGRRDPNGRTRRLLHSALFLGASAGFVYSGTQLANEAEQSAVKRRQHRDVNLVSMGVSTASWLLMLVNR